MIIFKIRKQIIIFLIFFLFLNLEKEIIISNEKNEQFLLEPQLECRPPNIFSFKNIFLNNSIIGNNSILILELYPAHYECTPGFSKYFIDLGYKVDVIINDMGKTTFCLFEQLNKIRVFSYKNIIQIKESAYSFSLFLKKYKYILIETTELNQFQLYETLNSLNINKTIFVFHHMDYINFFPFKNRLKQFQIVGLGKNSIWAQINPHYFGKLEPKKKNRITTFFITSTIKRNYSLLVSSLVKIENEKKQFNVIVVGKVNRFSEKNIPSKLKDYFIFKYKIPYFELYKNVYNCDFIIINLNPYNKDDEAFRKNRVTGSAQLVYGFLKPAIINKNFANFYYFNNSNSLIYDDFNLSKVLIEAINMDSKRYKKMQENLLLLSKEIFNISLYNLKNCLSKI